jgi:hypothetical protein
MGSKPELEATWHSHTTRGRGPGRRRLAQGHTALHVTRGREKRRWHAYFCQSGFFYLGKGIFYIFNPIFGGFCPLLEDLELDLRLDLIDFNLVQYLLQADFQ